MDGIPDSVIRFIGDHWPFIGAWMVFGIIIQVLKDAVFTQSNIAWALERTSSSRRHPDPSRGVRLTSAFYWWGYKTLPLQGMVMGVILGAVWSNPTASITTRPASMLYFAVAGALSVFAYQVIKGLAKKRGLDLDNAPPGSHRDPQPKPPKRG
jgi:hypothetical protein